MNRTRTTLLLVAALLALPSACNDDSNRNGPASARIDPGAATVTLQPIAPTGDSRDAWLILREGGQERGRWRIGSIWMGDWSDVDIEHASVGNLRAWWVSYRAGSGTGVGVSAGAVVWIDPGGQPAFWSGLWRRTESFSGPRPYEYTYATTLELAADAPVPVRLRIEVQGEDPDVGDVSAVFLCTPVRSSDGPWRMVVRNEDIATVHALLSVDSLSALRGHLQDLLPADE